MRKNNVKANICIICEGNEEFRYLERLKELGVWSEIYAVKLINAESIDKIAPRYQYVLSANSYDLVFVFCDTETEPYKQFNAVIQKINDLYGTRNASKNLVLFANPCTMQIILSHFEKLRLTTNKKSVNGKLIENLTCVSEYRATARQLDKLNKMISSANYVVMKTNLEDISSDPKVIPSTNFLQLLEHLESEDTEWIRKLQKTIWI